MTSPEDMLNGQQPDDALMADDLDEADTALDYDVLAADYEADYGIGYDDADDDGYGAYLADDDEDPADPSEQQASEEDARVLRDDPRACAILAAQAADAKKATDIVVQDVRNHISITDYFVIVSASNNRQVHAIIDEIEKQIRLKARLKPLHREETRDGSWELLDYGDFIVHVFQPETREMYRLEDLRSDAPLIDLAAEAGLTDIVYSDRIAALLK